MCVLSFVSFSAKEADPLAHYKERTWGQARCLQWATLACGLLSVVSMGYSRGGNVWEKRGSRPIGCAEEKKEKRPTVRPDAEALLSIDAEGKGKNLRTGLPAKKGLLVF